MRYKRNIHKVLVRNWKRKDYLQDVGEDGRTVVVAVLLVVVGPVGPTTTNSTATTTLQQ
jgi:hypothetical protein